MFYPPLLDVLNKEYRKDASYETDIVGEFEQTGYIEDEVRLYYYKFNADNTFEYHGEIIDRKTQFNGLDHNILPVFYGFFAIKKTALKDCPLSDSLN